MKIDSLYDVLIVGGGPAGLSAGLILGRCCRPTLICDAGLPRNWAAHRMHGVITRDGEAPEGFRHLALLDLQRYGEYVSFCDDEVIAVTKFRHHFAFALADGRSSQAKKVLLASGVLDQLPPLNRIEEFWGKSVFHCPLCEGFEMRHKPLAAFGKGQQGLVLARALTAWSADLVLLTHGPSGLSAEEIDDLAANGVAIDEREIAYLDGEGGSLQAVVFTDGDRLRRQGLFFDMPTIQQSPLAATLGCRFDREGGIQCDDHEATNVPGVFVAGNCIKDFQLVVNAIAEGAKAAININKALTYEAFHRKARGHRIVRHGNQTFTSQAHSRI